MLLSISSALQPKRVRRELYKIVWIKVQSACGIVRLVQRASTGTSCRSTLASCRQCATYAARSSSRKEESRRWTSPRVARAPLAPPMAVSTETMLSMSTTMTLIRFAKGLEIIILYKWTFSHSSRRIETAQLVDSLKFAKDNLEKGAKNAKRCFASKSDKFLFSLSQLYRIWKEQLIGHFLSKG